MSSAGLPGLESWPLIADRTETAVDLPVVTVRVRSRVYEPPNVAGFGEEWGDGVEISPRAVFRADLEFEPPPPRAPRGLLGIAARYARREFRRSLREDGLQAVRDRARRRLTAEDGTSLAAFKYTATYPLDGYALTGTAGDMSLPVAVWAGIWPTTDSFAMGGGVYPVETVPSVVESAGLRLKRPIELPVDPESDRRVTLRTLRHLAAAA
ncbi:MAG: hypothetical protein ABEJ35_05730 [Halobacteriaceae archaeon]